MKLIASDGEEKIACFVGTGPVDAAYKAIDSIIQVWLEKFLAFFFFLLPSFLTGECLTY